MKSKNNVSFRPANPEDARYFRSIEKAMLEHNSDLPENFEPTDTEIWRSILVDSQQEGAEQKYAVAMIGGMYVAHVTITPDSVECNVNRRYAYAVDEIYDRALELRDRLFTAVPVADVIPVIEPASPGPVPQMA